MGASPAPVAAALTVWLSAAPPGVPTALVPREDRFLLGTERGLYREGPAGLELVLTRGGVRDLARAEQTTWIATASGLYEWSDAAAEPRARALGVGARVAAVAVDASGTIWVASEVGLFRCSREESAFQREPSIPAGAVHAVRALGEQVWVATRGVLWAGGPGSVLEPRLRRLAQGWWELLGAAQTPAGTILAVPRGLWWLEQGARDAHALELGAGEVRDVAYLHGRLFVATRRGLLGLDPSRLPDPGAELVLGAEAFELAPDPNGLLVATRDGVVQLRAAAAPAASLPAAPALEAFQRDRSEPPVHAVHRAVLAYLGLSPGKLVEMEARARRSPLYPELRAGLSLDRGRNRDWDHDQSFTSGDVRELLDRSGGDELGQSLDVQLVWQLGKDVEPEQALAISRERRQLIELRDQVLERVNRLYFERLRVLARLAALPREASAERLEAELRARELAAQLDAWTGGSFSRLSIPSPPAQGRP